MNETSGRGKRGTRSQSGECEPRVGDDRDERWVEAGRGIYGGGIRADGAWGEDGVGIIRE